MPNNSLVMGLYPHNAIMTMQMIKSGDEKSLRLMNLQNVSK